MTSLLRGTLRLRARGPLPVDEVWQRYTQPAWWPRWAPHLREVDYPAPVVTPGTTGRVRGVGGVVAHFRIDAVDEAARTWSWSVTSGPLRLSFEHGVDAAPPGSGEVSSAWLVVHAAWPVALGYAPIARHALRRLVTSG
ncbi:SRPBCC family protein [Tessaracoccus sp. G1721]